MEPGTTGSSSASGTGEASSCMIWPWNGMASVYGTQLTPLCSLSAPAAAAWSPAPAARAVDVAERTANTTCAWSLR